MELGIALVLLSTAVVVTVCLQHLQHVRDQDLIRDLKNQLELNWRVTFEETVLAEKRHMETCQDLQEVKKS